MEPTKSPEQPASTTPQVSTPGDPPAATGPQGTMIVSVPLIERAGDRLDRYKLLQEIGEGGCGVVYMAEQEEPVRRRVALKVIKLGMDTKSVIARFEAERQALAMMDHPNIAKVLDAGATDNGRPFFVMELVRGVKLTEYCDTNKLSTEDRLKLFIQVCQAIQHAHQKGIIHRDIKPSNILVTMHDGVPVPKVIDFGIAKATQGRLTDQTLFTAFEQFIGTPAYMSPEQAEMSGLDVDTRSDIYALGVLLYELLTGKTPFDTKELLASGLDKLRQAIREREPERPSTRLRTMLQEDLTTTASRRHTDAPKLIHLVRGDLDWIVMKTLEKDRTRRYETANGLVMDIRRYLENEPVLARPPSNFYRLRKLVRRNRAAVAAAGAVCLALVVGFGLSLYLFLQEREARQRATAAEGEQARLRKQAEDALAAEARLQGRADVADKLSEAGPLVTQGRLDDAEKVLYQIQDPSTAPLLNNVAFARARAGDWPRAVTNYSRLVNVLPTEGFPYFVLAPLLVETGDLDGYERNRQRILRQFADTSVPVTLQRMLKACLLQPVPDADQDGVENLARTLNTLPPRLLSQEAFRVVRALFEYRQGHYNQALELLKNLPAGPRATPHLAVQACVISAMAQCHLGRTNDAQATLAHCPVTAEDNTAKLKVRDFGAAWNEWLFSHQFHREAEALLQRPTTEQAK